MLRVAVLRLPLLVGVPVQVGEQMKRMPGGTGSNPFAQMVEDADGLDKIEALQVRSGAKCLGMLELRLWRYCCASEVQVKRDRGDMHREYYS
jgi:hypothetical protein